MLVSALRLTVPNPSSKVNPGCPGHSGGSAVSFSRALWGIAFSAWLPQYSWSANFVSELQKLITTQFWACAEDKGTSTWHEDVFWMLARQGCESWSACETFLSASETAVSRVYSVYSETTQWFQHLQYLWFHCRHRHMPLVSLEEQQEEWQESGRQRGMTCSRGHRSDLCSEDTASVHGVYTLQTELLGRLAQPYFSATIGVVALGSFRFWVISWTKHTILSWAVIQHRRSLTFRIILYKAAMNYEPNMVNLSFSYTNKKSLDSWL